MERKKKMTSVSVLKGNVGQEPEVRMTPNGTKVVTYSIAVYRANAKDKDKPFTDWFNVVVFGEQADLAEANIHKGSKLIVTGKFQTRSYDSKEGKKVTVTEFWQDDFGIIPKKEQAGNVEDNGSLFNEDDLPF